MEAEPLRKCIPIVSAEGFSTLLPLRGVLCRWIGHADTSTECRCGEDAWIQVGFRQVVTHLVANAKRVAMPAP